MLTAILAMTGLSAVLGLLLGYSAIRFRVEGNPIADQIDAPAAADPVRPMRPSRLPSLRRGLGQGEDEINKCIPGGEATLLALADLLGREPAALEVEEKPPRWPSSTSRPASAAPSACRPARSTPSSAPPSSSTASSPPNARAASSVSRPARSSASTWSRSPRISPIGAGPIPAQRAHTTRHRPSARPRRPDRSTRMAAMLSLLGRRACGGSTAASTCPTRRRSRTAARSRHALARALVIPLQQHIGAPAAPSSKSASGS
jgi:hypothetical protein